MVNPRQTVIESWARRFDVSPEYLTRPGTHPFFKSADWVKPNRILVYRIHGEDPANDAVIVLIPETLTDSLTPHLGALDSASPSDSAAVIEAFGAAQSLRPLWRDHCFYALETEDVPSSKLVTLPTPGGFTTRPMKRENATDREAMTGLNEALSADERNEGAVSIEDPLCTGLWDGESLVAAASVLLDDDSPIADVGVIVHPAYRGRSLGKLVVSAVCAQGMPDRVLQYCAGSTNLGSLGIARGLGFSLLLTEEGIEIG